ncbi:histidine kinase [Alteromonas gilva]|uniref:Histidine kinase n=1 Tax=Alteromonas gilva TaxID=2987522 RepID=A0ABT5KY11_9ALTE|nr:histidine kinase [Alteromonas gilva]MDC8829660.1 histidine kinase [Alteromonas gilva]
MPASWRRVLFVLLPIIAAMLLESAIRFLSYRQPEFTVYLSVHGQLFAEMLPFFVAHYLAWRIQGRLKLLIWLIGFVGYPLLATMLAHHSSGFAQWHLLGMQGYCLAAAASVLWFIHRLSGRVIQSRESWLSRLLSLDAMVGLCLLIWSFTWAGIFLHTDNPMVNQPLELIIDFAQIVAELPLFWHYFWQFASLAVALFGVYWFNRYVLIRRLLAMHGVVPFLAGALVFILLVSAPVCAALLNLPLNRVTDFTLIPSGNGNPFDAFNYQMTFWLLAFSSPIILAFERKSQDARLADIARQKTRTELQLLQQQVNPHFLFNTLNNLYALCLEKSSQAPDMVEKLASLLRYTVYQGQSELVTLSDEISYLQDYLALQKLRHTDNCRFNCAWPSDNLQRKIPPLLLITVLENAFKHGIEKAAQPCELNMSITLNGNRLCFACDNPVAKARANTLLHTTEQVTGDSGGMGLDNLRRRLALQFGGRHSLRSEQVGDRWVTRLEMELAAC